MRVVATAGHVDHGKSSLVFALTGTDPDRFAEEKERGLTIDLGFAFTTLPSGTEIGFVDVPGHVKFVKNMLAGVGAVDVAVLVVAANEGWMPQSEEHLRILDLLGVSHGMVALTKADTVGADAVELAQLHVEERLAGSLLADAPIVVCDSISGRGLDDVRATLDAVLAAAPSPDDRRRPRMWIDRVFSARGSGTVVTGTLGLGGLAIDDELEVPSLGRRVRVRGIETAHRHVDRVAPGTRVAINLAGIEHGELARGDALVVPDQWSATTVVDIAVTGDELSSLHPSSLHPSRAGRLQAYVGSGEHMVSFRPLDPEQAYARLRFDTPLPLAPGDRLVLRDPGRAQTVAGAVVLDAEPSKSTSNAAARLALPLGPRLLASHRWIRLGAMPRLTGLDDDRVGALVAEMVSSGAAVEVGEWLVARGVLDELREQVRATVIAHHRDRPLDPGIELVTLAQGFRMEAGQLRAALDSDDELEIERGIVRTTDRPPRAADTDEGRALVDELDASPFTPPIPSNVPLARALVRDGTLVDVDGIVFTRAAVDRARAIVRDALRTRDALTIADVRELLGSTRKYVVPLLSRFDSEGTTRRRGDVRVAGSADEELPES